MPAAVVPLSELAEGQEADFFALLSEKQELTTRDGKPYFRVSFRDARREVGLPIWADSPLRDGLPQRMGGRRVLQAAGEGAADEFRAAAGDPPHSADRRRTTRRTASIR